MVTIQHVDNNTFHFNKYFPFNSIDFVNKRKNASLQPLIFCYSHHTQTHIHWSRFFLQLVVVLRRTMCENSMWKMIYNFASLSILYRHHMVMVATMSIILFVCDATPIDSSAVLWCLVVRVGTNCWMFCA